MRRGEVWLVCLDPTVGDELRKTRPAVIVSDDDVGVLQLRVVVPITGWQPRMEDFPWIVRLAPTARSGLTKASAADAFQVKSVSTRRFVTRMGELSEEELDLVTEAVGVVIAHP